MHGSRVLTADQVVQQTSRKEGYGWKAGYTKETLETREDTDSWWQLENRRTSWIP